MWNKYQIEDITTLYYLNKLNDVKVKNNTSKKILKNTSKNTSKKKILKNTSKNTSKNTVDNSCLINSFSLINNCDPSNSSNLIDTMIVDLSPFNKLFSTIDYHARK